MFSRDGCYVEPYTGKRVTESAGLLTPMIARPVNLTQGTNCCLLAIVCTSVPYLRVIECLFFDTHTHNTKKKTPNPPSPKDPTLTPGPAFIHATAYI